MSSVIDVKFSDKDKNEILEAKGRMFSFFVEAGKLFSGSVSHFIHQHCILSGGAIQAIFNKDQVNDYDVYFDGDYEFDNIENMMLSDPYIEANIVSHGEYKLFDSKTGGYSKKFKLITVRNNPDNSPIKKPHIQFIFGNYFKLREDFDYLHCLPYYVHNTQKLYISPEQFYCIKNKILCKVGAFVDSKRTAKYKGRGWKSKGSYDELFKVIDEKSESVSKYLTSKYKIDNIFKTELDSYVWKKLVEEFPENSVYHDVYSVINKQIIDEV
jgi:hypothetical protein